jgi:hypothetical protein
VRREGSAASRPFAESFVSFRKHLLADWYVRGRHVGDHGVVAEEELDRLLVAEQIDHIFELRVLIADVR